METASGYACPGCAVPMRRQSFARRPDGQVTLDLCFECHAIWFDEFESSQLTPGATIELFRLIHERGTPAARPVSDTAGCPVCHRRLALTHDIQRSNRFVYHRCPQRHGRFTTFFHFLREKQFIRSLTNVEIDKLKATVQQVRCSGCGAPVHVERDAACGYCHAPLAILDAGAVQRTLDELTERERSRPAPDPAGAIDAILAGRHADGRRARHERGGSGEGMDLVREVLAFLSMEVR
jgi:hypothetical protein